MRSRPSPQWRITLAGAGLLALACIALTVFPTMRQAWCVVLTVAVGAALLFLLTGAVMRSVPPPSNHSAQLLAEKEAALAAQKRLTQNAAEALRAPIASIAANIEKAGQVEGITPDMMRIIETDARSADTLLGELTALYGDPCHDTRETIPFSELLKPVAATLQDELRLRHISLSLAGDTVLYGDQAQLQLAFGNILRNAVRYNHPGGRVLITCTPGGVSISDTGIGIPDEALPHVCEPFYTVDPLRSQALGSHGLGLSVAQKIFDRHGMRMVISSDSGTTVTVFTGRKSGD